MTPTPTVYIVDDDEVLREALVFLFESRGFRALGYASAELFMAYRRAQAPSKSASDTPECALVDVRLQGQSGLELFQSLKREGASLPVVLLTGHGDVSMAVNAIKAGAFDFVEKPFSDNDLVDRVAACLTHAAGDHATALRDQAWQQRLALLSPRERQVMERVAAGQANKVIAIDLELSIRTVEVHRARMFEKLGVRGAVELTRLVAGPA